MFFIKNKIGVAMYVLSTDVAEMLDVHPSTVIKWARKAGLKLQGKSGPGKKSHDDRLKVPVRALLNYLACTDILPFKHIERESNGKTEYQKDTRDYKRL